MSSTFRSKFITGVLLLLLCFVTAYFLATPLWHKYSQAKTGLEAANAKAESLSQSVAMIDNFVSQYNKQGSEVEAANQALPPKNLDTANLISSLNDLAAASGVSLGNLQVNELASPERPAIPNSIQTVRVDLSATGTYMSFKDFVLRLETDLRLSDIQKVSLASDESGLLRYQLVLYTYYQK